MITPNSTSLARLGLASYIAVLTACSDGEPTSAAPVDPMQEIHSVQVRVNTEIALLQISGKTPVHRLTGFAEQRVANSSRWNSMSAAPSDEPRTIVKHFRQADGRTLSLGWYFRKGSEPPTLIYAFVDGRIQTVVGLAYTRHGRGYLRRRVRVTTFDSTGIAQGQINIASESNSGSAASIAIREVAAVMQGIAADVLSVVLPQELHAEETGACGSEYLSYLAASVKLAAAAAALQVATASCVTVPGTQPIACPAAGTAFIAFVDMLDRWNRALDKLVACTEAASADSSPGGDGGGADDGTADDDFFGDYEETKKTVEQFISESIASNRYTCSSNGDVCTYYAE
jgi:hypothetical protein